MSQNVLSSFSVSTPTASTTASTTTTAATAPGIVAECCDWETRMNAIASAMLSGLLYFARGPSYPHPLPVVSRKEYEATSVAARQRRVPCLPPELYSVIASHLSNQHHTLAACALVSSAWCSASRRFLFHTVTLTYTNIQPFLDLLHNPICSFKNAIKVVKMREGEFMVDRWMDCFLPRLTTSFHDNNMRVLDVYNLTWSELSPRSAKTLQQDIRSVESLRVGTCYWECVHEFAELVCSESFDGLKHLVCDYVLLNCSIAGSCECKRVDEVIGSRGSRAQEEGDEETSRRDLSTSLLSSPKNQHRSPAARLPQTLESLYLSLPEESMLQWFTTQDTAMRGLKKLGISVRDSTVIELVQELVSRTGSSLEELVLDLPLGCSILLARNMSLRTLRLRIPSLFSLCYDTSQVPSNTTPAFIHHHHQHYYPLQTLSTLLSSLSSPFFHTLIFDIDATSLAHLHNSTNGSYNPRLYDFASVILPHVPVPSSPSTSIAATTVATTANTSPRSLSLVFTVRYSGTLKIVERAKKFICSFVQVLREESSSSSSLVDCSRWDVSVEGVRVGCSGGSDSGSGSDGNFGGGDAEDADADAEGGKYEDVEGEEEEEEKDGWRREGVGEVWRSWIGGD